MSSNNVNKKPAVLNIIESYFLHRTELYIQAKCHVKLYSEQIYISANNYIRLQKLA